ncbi:Hypothetical protein A7982_09416 [Minicystis rosea]|nr:Hypothetical protein A7982_09416 [Minicystis rosea]
MDERLRRLDWEEQATGRAREFRARRRRAPEGSIFSAIFGGLVLLVLRFIGPGARGCGWVAVIALLFMAVPVLFVGLAALADERWARRFHVIRIDPERLVASRERSKRTTTLATRDIGDFVGQKYGGVTVLDRDGKSLGYLDIDGPPYVISRLRAAIDEMREALTYRG